MVRRTETTQSSQAKSRMVQESQSMIMFRNVASATDTRLLRSCLSVALCHFLIEQPIPESSSPGSSPILSWAGMGLRL